MVRTGLTFRFFSWPYLSRLLFAGCFSFVCFYLNTLASVVAGYRTPSLQYTDARASRDQLVTKLIGQRRDRDSLPDFGHDSWEYILTKFGAATIYIEDYSLPDKLCYWLIIATCIFVALHPQRFMILRRSLVILGSVLLLRGTCVLATQLPDASPTCQAQFSDPVRGAYKTQKMYPAALYRAWRVLWAPTKHVTCGDMVFSGHTTVLFLCHMIFRRYCKAKWVQTKVIFRAAHVSEELCTAVRWLTLLYVCAGSLAIVGTRLHYTLDVLIAIFVTCSVFNRYHSYLRYKKLAARGWLPFLFVLRWFEAEEMMEIDEWAYESAKRAK